jgi:hypothetical protein
MMDAWPNDATWYDPTLGLICLIGLALVVVCAVDLWRGRKR